MIMTNNTYKAICVHVQVCVLLSAYVKKIL